MYRNRRFKLLCSIIGDVILPQFFAFREHTIPRLGRTTSEKPLRLPHQKVTVSINILDMKKFGSNTVYTVVCSSCDIMETGDNPCASTCTCTFLLIENIIFVKSIKTFIFQKQFLVWIPSSAPSANKEDINILRKRIILFEYFWHLH